MTSFDAMIRPFGLPQSRLGSGICFVIRHLNIRHSFVIRISSFEFPTHYMGSSFTVSSYIFNNFDLSNTISARVNPTMS